MKRIYDQLVLDHLKNHRQMVFLTGPRQVGKTTTSLHLKEENKNFYYFNWDFQKTREFIIKGPQEIAGQAKLLTAAAEKPLLVFDEIHKYGKWKQFLKGFFDVYHELCQIIVTGSAKLNVYKSGGDSLMGRYFLYRIHPFSVAELLQPTLIDTEIRPPSNGSQVMKDLLEFGGFPEPFLKKNKRFSVHWQRLKQQQFFKEDIRSISQIHELSQLEMLSNLLQDFAGSLISYNNLANLVNVSNPTIRRWLNCMESIYYCYHIKPWTKNIKRTLKREPKYYLWDWSQVKDEGARIENFVASHLLKATQFWTDYGLGEYGLYYLRDKEKREVDFLVTKNNTPWFLVEVKKSNQSSIGKSLYFYQEQTGAEHAFQVVYDMDYVEKDLFSYKTPIICPMSTFLSQLV